MSVHSGANIFSEVDPFSCESDLTIIKNKNVRAIRSCELRLQKSHY